MKIIELFKERKWGQSTLEYAILIGLIAVAVMAMTPYVRRAVQGNLKMIENQINANIGIYGVYE